MEFRLLKYAFKNTWLAKLLEEKVFTVSLLLAISTSLVIAPKLTYINFKVIFSLFNLMVVVSAFESLKVMDGAAVKILSKCSNLRMVGLVMLSLTFFSSMLVTNDVALITFVPLTLIISKKASINPLHMIIFQTLAANIGSSLTPMGNPQNLFLFSLYKLTGIQFFRVMIPFVILGAIWLAALNLMIPQRNLHLQLTRISIQNKNQVILFGVLFIAIILSIFNLIDYKIAFLLTILIVIWLDKSLLKKVDFFLLATFVCFFIFIGNLSHIEFIYKNLNYLLNNGNKTYFTSILLSQLVSNVPASILIANFTGNWKQVLLGVNIGGMGTLIASLASLISYKLYINDAGTETSVGYLGKFTLYNVLSLILFTVINFSLLQLKII